MGIIVNLGDEPGVITMEPELISPPETEPPLVLMASPSVRKEMLNISCIALSEP